MQVFEKAHRCVQDNKKKNVKAIVVVVLDEVGLAEISSSNPLKVTSEFQLNIMVENFNPDMLKNEHDTMKANVQSFCR